MQTNIQPFNADAFGAFVQPAIESVVQPIVQLFVQLVVPCKHAVVGEAAYV